MEEVVIRGKSFSKSEVEEKGRQKIKKITNLFRWLGVGLFGLGIIGGIGAFASVPADADASAKTSPIIGALMLIIPGIILFIISFKKRDAFEYGKKKSRRISLLRSALTEK